MGLDEVLNYLQINKDAKNRIADEFFKQQELKNRKAIDVKTNIKDYMDILLKYLKVNEYVDNERLTYSDEDVPVLKEYFDDIFDQLNEYAQLNYLDLQNSNDYGEVKFIVKHENHFIQFHMMVGQGTYIGARIIDHAKTKKYFTTEQYAVNYRFDTLSIRKSIAKKNFYRFLKSIESLKLSKADILEIVFQVLKYDKDKEK